MKEKIKIYITHEYKAMYASWIDNYNIVYEIEKADLVLFPGGADVNPSLYGHKKDSSTSYASSIDYNDLTCFKKASELNIPMLGICRGMQFLSVMAGGTLIQDLPNHGGKMHDLTFSDGSNYSMSSSHHQALYTPSLDNEKSLLLAWTIKKPGNIYKGDDGAIIDIKGEYKESEITYFPKINALGIQGHPEYATVNKETRAKCNELIQDYLFNESPEIVA